jgi:hypothetical protein
LKDRKRSQKKRKFGPSPRHLWPTIPSKEVPYHTDGDHTDDHLCESCYYHLVYHYPPPRPVHTPKSRKGALVETLPPRKPTTLSCSPVKLISFTSASEVRDLTVSINITEWIALVDGRSCVSAVCEDLRRTTPGCSGKIKFQELVTEGKFMVMKTACDKCGERIHYFNSSPKMIREHPKKNGKGFRLANVKVVASVLLLERGSYTSYARKLATTEGSKIKEGSWKRIEKVVWKAVKAVADETYTKVAADLLQRKGCIMISGDGAWSQRRNALHGTYSILDLVDDKVIVQVVLNKGRKVKVNGKELVIEKGNHDATSKAMEGVGFRKCIDYLEEKGLLSKVLYCVCDRDGSVRKHLKEDNRCAHIIPLDDPGHALKPIRKELESVFGKSKRYINYPRRMMKWLMRCLKECCI